MPNFATTVSVLLAVFAGATFVRFCDYAEHKLLRRRAGTGFPDVLGLGDEVKYSDFGWMVLPPIAGGMILAFWPATNGSAAGAAGLLAGFLAVWPLYRFPVQLLQEDLQPFWPKQKLFYTLFVGMSAALTYLGFIVVDRTLPAAGTLARAELWVQFLDRLSTHAIYEPVKYALAALLVIGGVYFNREWVRIRVQASRLKQEVVIREPPSQQSSLDV